MSGTDWGGERHRMANPAHLVSVRALPRPLSVVKLNDILSPCLPRGQDAILEFLKTFFKILWGNNPGIDHSVWVDERCLSSHCHFKAKMAAMSTRGSLHG